MPVRKGGGNVKGPYGGSGKFYGDTSKLLWSPPLPRWKMTGPLRDCCYCNSLIVMLHLKSTKIIFSATNVWRAIRTLRYFRSVRIFFRASIFFYIYVLVGYLHSWKKIRFPGVWIVWPAFTKLKKKKTGFYVSADERQRKTKDNFNVFIPSDNFIIWQETAV